MITLRNFNEFDSASLVQVLNESEVVKCLSSKIPTPYTLQDAKWWITTGSKMGIVKAIECNGKLVGCIGAERGENEYQRSAEVGYWIARDKWGQGIATQAIAEFTPYVFQTSDIERLFASVFSGNMASMRVLEKCGFELEGVHNRAIYKNNTFYNDHVFALLKT